MTLGPAKHEEVARIGRISNVFRVLSACDTRLARTEAEQSVGIQVAQILFHNLITIRKNLK